MNMNVTIGQLEFIKEFTCGLFDYKQQTLKLWKYIKKHMKSISAKTVELHKTNFINEKSRERKNC